MYSQAEVKLLKFKETLTSNVDGDLEPSRLENSNWACAETRQGVCIKCSNVITNKRKGLKFCSSRCRTAYNSYNHYLRKNKFKKPGAGSGGNQIGRNNHQYKNGIGTYRNIAFEFKDAVCEQCNSTLNLLAHHIDENRSNNELHNLKILCKKCHQDYHCKRDNLGRYAKE